MAATSSAPSAEPWALPVFCALGAGQAMIVRSLMKLGPVGDPLRPSRAPSHERLDVLVVLGAAVGPVDGLDVPAVGLVARGDVLAERDVGVVLDRDLVVVVDQREVAELLVAGERGGLAADALLEVAVAARWRRRGGRRGSRPAAASGSSRPRSRRAAIAMPTALPTPWPSGPVVVSTPAVWPYSGVAGGHAAPGAQRLEVVELEAEAAEVQLDVEGEAGVAAGEHEPVAARPSAGRRGCAASPSGTAGTPRAPGSSPCRGGRCRPSAPRPSPAPGRCRPSAGRGQSNRAC